MRKLYIIEYSTLGTSSWYWANNEQEAMQEAKEADEATDNDFQDAQIWSIDEAVCKHDITEALNRYILKPLKK